MNHKNQENKENQEETTIQRKSWQDGGGGDGGSNNNNSPNNNDGFTDNSQSAKEALQLQKMAESSSEHIQLKKWADNIGGGGDATPNDNPVQKKENKTGLPDNLKTGMENNSGIPLGDVKVHRNSEKPAQLNAHAYAQGTDIHLGPGQEKHLPHELGHVVQQKKGIVKPTTQQNGAAINDDKGLEKNADTLGAKALQPTAQLKAKDTGSDNSISNLSQVIQQWQMEDKAKMNTTSIQRKVVQREEEEKAPDTENIEELAGTLQLLGQGYINWVKDNCKIPSSDVFELCEKNDLDPKKALDLYSPGNPPTGMGAIAEEVAANCEWIPMAALISSCICVVAGGVGAVGAKLAGAGFVDLLLGSKWLADGARISISLLSNSEYAGLDEWLFYHLSKKDALVREWAAAEGKNLNEKLIKVITGGFK
jgi:HPt (histidine-containing phosphotransfer) domain-containing protein